MEDPWFRVGLNSDLLNKTIPTDKVDKVVHVDMDSTFGNLSNNINEGKQEAENLTSLNAFDIISLSSGFDLSAMFEDENSKEESKFTSTNTATTITKKLEDVAKNLRLKFLKKNGGLLKMEGSKPGRKGVMSINAEIFQITPDFHLVEFTKINGDTLEYQKVKQEMRPALKDIVWAWQGEQPQPQSLNEQS